MKPFEYFAPHALHEATDILASYGNEARAVAGGTDLLLKMKAGKLAPKAVVNIKRVPELHGHVFNSHFCLGSLTTLEEMRRSPIIREHYPALADAASTMASIQIRNLATVGGNLCNAAPSADLAPILIALEAVARMAGPGGERRVPLDEFFIGPGLTVLAPGELLVSIEVPPPHATTLYLKHAPRECMDIAIAGVGLALRLVDGVCAGARIVLGAVAPAPLRAQAAESELIGKPITLERIEYAARIAAEESKPIDDVRGSAWYRRRMVEVLTRRGLLEVAGNHHG